MRYPRIVVYADHDHIEAELRPLAAEHRWLLHGVRQARAMASAVLEARPTVAVVEADPSDETAAALELLCESRLVRPDVPILVVSPVKLSELDRTYWSAAVLDLGATFVLYPPLDRSVLEDLVSNMMRGVLEADNPSTAPGPSES